MYFKMCCKTMSVGSMFHKLRINDLPKMWSEFTKHADMTNLSRLVCQYVNQRLYAELVKSKLTSNLTKLC